MDLQPAVAALPEPYRKALHSTLDGADEEQLAETLGVPLEAARNLVLLAVAKLSNLITSDAFP